MPTYSHSGELETHTYPAHLEEMLYWDTVVVRITGIRADIDETIELYIQEYPVGPFEVAVLTKDARFLGPAVVETSEGKAVVDVYELLLARKANRRVVND